MKKKLLLFSAILIASLSACFIQAQTDVTSMFLKNADFETAPIVYATADGTPTAGTTLFAASGLGQRVYIPPGWTSAIAGSGSNAVYARMATVKYGITFSTVPDILNGVQPPAADKNGKGGAALNISGAYSTTASLTQEVTLPAGNYELQFDAIDSNGNGGNAIVTNYFGFEPASGTPVYGTQLSFANVWTTYSVTFTLNEATSGKIRIGVSGTSGGSGGQAKLHIDNIKLLYDGAVDKTVLNNRIAEAETIYGNGSGVGAAALNNAIEAAKAVTNNASATMPEVVQVVSDLNAVISAYQLINAKVAETNAKIAEAKTVYGDGSGVEAAALSAVIEAAKAVTSNVNATIAQLNQAISDLDVAIYNYQLANATTDSPVNVTSMLTNPSFENSDRFQGWTNPGTFGAATSNPTTLGFTKNGTVFIEKYIAPPATLGDFSIYQTIAVPNGQYKLTASAQARINENGTNPAFAEGAVVYANSAETTVSTGADYSATVFVSNGSLTVGFKTIAGKANWVAADNFRLEYLGFDLTAMVEGLQASVDAAGLITGKMQTTVATELAAAITAAKAAIATPDKTALNTTATRLAAAVTAANASIEIYASLQAIIEQAQAILPSSGKGVNGYDQFFAAFAADTAMYRIATANAATVTAATGTLKAAILAYTFANVSEATTVLDITYLISNPSFEQNQGDKQQTIPGWTKTGAANGEYCTRNDAGPNSGAWKTGNVYFQYWSNASLKPDFSISQELTSLPNGKYTLKVAAGEGGTGIFVYANDKQVEVTGMNDYSINDVIVTEGKLTIGFKSVNRSALWAYADNFRLYYNRDLSQIVSTPGIPETTFTAGKSYYVGNAGAGKLLTHGGNWATQATVNPVGAPITFTEVSEGSGTYYLQYVNADATKDIGTMSYLRTSDLFSDQLTIATTVGTFSITKATDDSYFTLLSTDANANGKYLAANQAAHSSADGRWGVATGTSAYGLNMAKAESDYTQWYFYDIDLYDARYNLLKLLNIAEKSGLANLSDHIAAYNAAETVAAANEAMDALRTDISESVNAPLDFTSYVDGAGINDGVTAITTAKWKSINPTNSLRVLLPGMYSKVASGKVTAGSFEFFNTNFNFNQTLTGLPVGTYTLKAQAFERATNNDGGTAYTTGAEVIQSKIYAVSSIGEFVQPSKSLYTHAYETDMAGSQVNGYINNMEAAQNAFLKGYYEIELPVSVGEDGTMTIGIKKEENAVNSWIMFDNFRLIYESASSLEAFNILLAEKMAEAQNCIDNADMGWFNSAELESAIAAGTSVEQTVDAINAAISGLNTAISNFNDIVNRYQPLKDRLAEVNTIIAENDYAGEEAFQDAIDTAQAVYDNTEEQTAEVIQAAIKALNQAYVAYYISGLTTTPSVDNPADFTRFLVNPDFEALQIDRQEIIPGWTKTGAANSEYCTRNDAGPNSGAWKSGNVYFQYWSAASPKPDYSISQTLNYLPDGKYTIKAFAGGDSQTSGTFVYANNAQAVVVDGTKDYSIDVVVRNNTLTVGFKSVNRATNWSYADNFRLYYGGEVEPSTLSVDTTKFNFFPFSTVQSFVVSGSNLIGNVTLTAPTGITLSKNTITPAEATTGVTVTATFSGSATIAGGAIAIAAATDGLSQSIAVNAFPLTGKNLIQYWSGLGAEAAGTRPTNVGWSNTKGDTIPWADANTGSGCRFRDKESVTGNPIVYESDGAPLNDRHLMLRWDGRAYYESVYAYPVVLKAATKYMFDFDVFLGGNGGKAKAINIGISTTPDETGRLSSEVVNFSLELKVNKAPTYKFTSEAAGLYYITFKGNDFSEANWPWVGVANLVLAIDTEVSIAPAPASSGKLAVYPSVTSDLLTVNKEEGTRISIYNVSGNKVMETTLSNPLNVGSLESGIYVIGTENGEKAKFIKK